MKNASRTVFATAALLAYTIATIATATAQEQEAAPPSMKDIEDAAAAEMARSGSPSLQITVAYEGELVFEKALGRANLEYARPATSETRYRTASTAKWLTATAAMRLAEAGKLDLDAPVQSYCPQFPEKTWPITTRQLLTHTSGIRHDADYDAQLAAAKSDAERLEIERRRHREMLGRWTRYDNVTAPLENFDEDPLLFQPGTRWRYASPGYRVLACVLEGASGLAYRDLMQKSIFGPAGMSHTVPDDAWAIIPDRAGLYQVLNRELELRHADYRDVSENLPAGGYLSTASDLVAFAQMFISGDFVSGDSVSLMTRPVADEDMVWEVPPQALPVEVPHGPRYGHGIMLFPSENGPWIGHTGRQDGASSIVVVSPDRKCVVAVMLNVRSWARGFDFTRDICALAARSA